MSKTFEDVLCQRTPHEGKKKANPLTETCKISRQGGNWVIAAWSYSARGQIGWVSAGLRPHDDRVFVQMQRRFEVTRRRRATVIGCFVGK